MIKVSAVLVIGVIATALSFVFIRESTEAPAMLAGFRVLIAGLVLLPVYLQQRKRYGDSSYALVFKRSLLPGLVLGIHFIAWVVGARLTTAANATLIVSLVPLVMPFLMFWQFGERLQRPEVIATVLAISGMLMLTINDFTISKDYLLGDGVSFISMLLFALYLTVARRYASLASVWLYIVPVYLVAGISTVLLACLFSSPFHSYSLYNLSMILGLALVSTVIGHTAFNYAMQQLRGQTVSIAIMSQFIVAAIAGFVLYNEVPPLLFYPASVLLLVAVLLVILNQSGKPAANR